MRSQPFISGFVYCSYQQTFTYQYRNNHHFISRSMGRTRTKSSIDDDDDVDNNKDDYF